MPFNDIPVDGLATPLADREETIGPTAPGVVGIEGLIL